MEKILFIFGRAKKKVVTSDMIAIGKKNRQWSYGTSGKEKMKMGKRGKELRTVRFISDNFLKTKLKRFLGSVSSSCEPMVHFRFNQESMWVSYKHTFYVFGCFLNILLNFGF